MSENTAIYGIVLASGSSSRFGDEDKLAARIGNQSVLFRTVSAYEGATDKTWVVLRRGDIRSASDLTMLGVEVIWNDCHLLGQSASLRLGVGALPEDAGAAVIGVADQPLLNTSTIKSLIVSWRREPIATVVPTYAARRGNPVLFARCVFPELTEVQGDRGGRDVIKRSPSREIAIAQWWTGMDIDTRQDVVTAEKYYRHPPI